MSVTSPVLSFFVTCATVASTALAVGCGGASQRNIAMHNIQQPTTLEQVKSYAEGRWQSLSVELRPTEDRAGIGKVEPTRLRREFTYFDDDTFIGIITMYADDYGKVPLMEFEFTGSLRWGGPHPIAEGAYEIDYVLDKGFALTPLSEQMTAMLNQGGGAAEGRFQTGAKQDLLGQAFPLFNIAEGQILSDYDLIYFRNGMLFMGAKHVDGTPFDQPERRPHQLQIPLVKVHE